MLVAVMALEYSETMRKSWKRWPILILFSLHLAACDNRAERYPPAQDFCAKENRKISVLEKKALVLTRMYFGSGNPKYISEHIHSEIGKNASEQQVKKTIADFVGKNPLCCQLLVMDHLANEVFNDNFYTADTYDNDYKWGYLADLYVFTADKADRPFYKIDSSIRKEDLRHGGVLMINNCGEAKGFFRG